MKTIIFMVLLCGVLSATEIDNSFTYSVGQPDNSVADTLDVISSLLQAGGDQGKLLAALNLIKDLVMEEASPSFDGAAPSHAALLVTLERLVEVAKDIGADRELQTIREIQDNINITS